MLDCSCTDWVRWPHFASRAWRPRSSASFIAVLPTLRFTRETGLVLLWSCVFFEDLLVACFWACFNWNLLVFWVSLLQSSDLQIAFFPDFMALLPFQFTAKGILGVFLWKFAHFGLVFSNLPPWFYVWFSFWFLVLLNFPANAFWACFSVKLPIFCLFLKFTCLFLRNDLASLFYSFCLACGIGFHVLLQCHRRSIFCCCQSEAFCK